MSEWKDLALDKPQDGQYVIALYTRGCERLTIGRYNYDFNRVMIQVKSYLMPEVTEDFTNRFVRYWLPLDADPTLLDAQNWPRIDDLMSNNSQYGK